MRHDNITSVPSVYCQQLYPHIMGHGNALEVRGHMLQPHQFPPAQCRHATAPQLTSSRMREGSVSISQPMLALFFSPPDRPRTRALPMSGGRRRGEGRERGREGGRWREGGGGRKGVKYVLHPRACGVPHMCWHSPPAEG